LGKSGAAAKRSGDAVSICHRQVVGPNWGNNLVFTKPEFIAEVEFRASTGDGKLRHASFKGLRDKADRSTVYEMADP
jgi:bifunctional non-homologous end joining protein LigD